MPLKIAFIGYNNRLTMVFFDQFVRDNREQVEFYDLLRGRAVLKDGTTIEAIWEPCLDGKRYDQAIIADDWRMEVYSARRDAINWLHLSMACSVIAEEFRFQHYDPDAKEAET